MAMRVVAHPKATSPTTPTMQPDNRVSTTDHDAENPAPDAASTAAQTPVVPTPPPVVPRLLVWSVLCGCHDIERYCARTEAEFAERRCISPTAGLFSALMIYGLSFPAMIVFWTLALGKTLLLRHWVLFQGACAAAGVVLPSMAASIVRRHPVHFVASLLTFVWMGALMSVFLLFIGLAHFGHATGFLYPARDWNYEHWDDGRNIGQGFVIFLVLVLLSGAGIGVCCACIVACGKSYHEAKVQAAAIQQQREQGQLQAQQEERQTTAYARV